MVRLHAGRARRRAAEPATTGGGPIGAVAIAPMRRRHLKAVLAIEQQVFPSPWSIGLYLSELAQPATRAYHVAIASGDVLGYGGMMLVAGEAHVTTLAVAPGAQHRGIGRHLMLVLAKEARERACQHLTLEVRVKNTSAQGLYQEFGLVPAGIRKNYYSEVNEDALVMWVHGIDTEQYAQRLAAIEARTTGVADQR